MPKRSAAYIKKLKLLEKARKCKNKVKLEGEGLDERDEGAAGRGLSMQGEYASPSEEGLPSTSASGLTDVLRSEEISSQSKENIVIDKKDLIDLFDDCSMCCPSCITKIELNTTSRGADSWLVVNCKVCKEKVYSSAPKRFQGYNT